MIPNGYMVDLGVPAEAEVSACGGRLLAISPPQSKLLTAIVAANCAGEFDNATDSVRAIRDKLLSITDWTQSADSPLSDEQRYAWSTYRQALRDLPATRRDGNAIQWPMSPPS